MTSNGPMVNDRYIANTSPNAAPPGPAAAADSPRLQVKVLRVPRLSSSLSAIFLYVVIVVFALCVGIAAAVMTYDLFDPQTYSTLGTVAATASAVVVIVGISALGIKSVEGSRLRALRRKRPGRWQRLTRICARPDAAKRAPHRLLEHAVLTTNDMSRAMHRVTQIELYTPSNASLIVPVSNEVVFVASRGKSRAVACTGLASWALLAGWISRAETPSMQKLRTLLDPPA